MNNKLLLQFMVLSMLLLESCNKPQDGIFPNSNLKCSNCNVILIDLTASKGNHFGSYGYFRNTTPNIDTIADKGFVFENAISASSWTLPSVMSVFTSTYPSKHGLKNSNIKNKEGKLERYNLKKFNSSISTLTEIMKKNNYVTAGFTGDAHLNGTYGYSNGFDAYYDELPFAGFDTTLPLALDWIKQNKNEKFFLFIQGYDLHGRYRLANDSSRKFIDDGYKGIYTGAVEEQLVLRNLSLEKGYINLSDEDKKFWISIYDSKLYDADQRLGKFFSETGKLGVLDNSIVIIMGDHGEELFEHNRIDHGFSLYDELIHVPLMIYLPSYNRQIRIRNQVRTIDIMPTIIDLTGVNGDSIRTQMKGESLVPLMKGQRMDLDAFSETDYLYQAFKRAIIKPDGWKFIYSLDTNERELYNLNSDPREKNNLVDKELQKAYELEQEMFKQMYS